PVVTLYTRDGDRWTANALSDDGDAVLTALGISIPVAEIFEGVTWPVPDASNSA
ncbi:MAG: hypothetical protein JOY70_01395, partial [Acidisphaera sp.]|nr:hypothetical protein [Acidisphaera sp.]